MGGELCGGSLVMSADENDRKIPNLKLSNQATFSKVSWKVFSFSILRGRLKFSTPLLAKKLAKSVVT